MNKRSGAVPTPNGTGESCGAGIRGAGYVLLLTAIAGFVAWCVPDVLSLAGQPRLASRLAHDGLLRAFLLGATVVLLVAGNLLTRAVVRDARLPERPRRAVELGGEVTAARGLDVASGETSGPGLWLEVAGRLLTVAAVSSRTRPGGARTTETRAQVAYASDDLFGFQVLSHRHPVRMIGGLQGVLFRKSIGDALGRAKTKTERRSIESVRFIGEPAVTTLPADLADICTLRTNDPARAVAVLTAPGVPGALRELGRLARSWEWSRYPAKQPGRVELTVTLPGGGADTEAIRAVRALMASALEALGEAKAA